MKTIDCSGYSGEWVARALAAMKADGVVLLLNHTAGVQVTWREKLDNEKRLTDAAAKLKWSGK